MGKHTCAPNSLHFNPFHRTAGRLRVVVSVNVNVTAGNGLTFCHAGADAVDTSGFVFSLGCGASCGFLSTTFSYWAWSGVAGGFVIGFNVSFSLFCWWARLLIVAGRLELRHIAEEITRSPLLAACLIGVQHCTGDLHSCSGSCGRIGGILRLRWHSLFKVCILDDD